MSAPKKDRRELLRSAARGLAVAALAGGALLLARRNAGTEDCPPRTTCADCRLRDRCDRKPRISESNRP
jgi:hypothetical protein